MKFLLFQLVTIFEPRAAQERTEDLFFLWEDPFHWVAHASDHAGTGTAAAWRTVTTARSCRREGTLRQR